MLDLLGQVTEHLQAMLHSPWLWLVVFLVAGLDAVLPFMPSETTVIIVAVLVTSSALQLTLLVIVAATGALAGDALGYAIGRWAGPGALARLERRERGRNLRGWAHTRLHAHARLLLIAGRYIPGVRAVTMITAGALGYPPRRFLAADAIGTTLWAIYATLIGYLGGATFTDHPDKGVLLALAIGLVLAVLLEAGRRLARNQI